MSIFGKTPYIEAKLSALSEAQLTSLATLINTSADSGDLYTLESLRTSLTEDTIVAARIQFNPACYRTGYLIFKKNAFCTFISKELNYEGKATIYDLDLAKLKYHIVKEECSIEEIRRIVALGSGSVSVTIDSALSTTSENPVQNKVITNALTQVVELTGLTGTLSDSDYAKVSADNCIIKVGTQSYYKAFGASLSIVYQAFSRQGGTGTALYDYVEITKADKSYQVLSSDIVRANPSGDATGDLNKIGIGNGIYNTTPIATPTQVGGVKPVGKNSSMTSSVGIDVDGKLYVEPADSATIVSAVDDYLQENPVQPTPIDDQLSFTSSHGISNRTMSVELGGVIGEGDKTITGEETSNITLLTISGISIPKEKTITMKVPNFSTYASGWSYRLNGGAWQTHQTNESFSLKLSNKINTTLTSIGIYFYLTTDILTGVGGTLHPSVEIDGINGEIKNLKAEDIELQSDIDENSIKILNTNDKLESFVGELNQTEFLIQENKYVDVRDGSINDDGGRIKDVYSYDVSNFVGGWLEYFKNDLSNGNQGAAFYDANGVFIQGFGSGTPTSEHKIIQIPSNAAVFKQTYRKTGVKDYIVLYKFADSFTGSEKARKETYPSFTTTNANGSIKASDGSWQAVSSTASVKVDLQGISHIYLRTTVGYSPQAALAAWATYDAKGTCIRTSGELSTGTVWTYFIDINPETEKYFIYSYQKNMVDYTTIQYSTDLNVREQMLINREGLPVGGLFLHDQSIYEMLTTMLNSNDFANDMETILGTDYDDNTPANKHISDCSMAYDSDNFYVVGCWPSPINSSIDLLQGSGMGVDLRVINRQTKAVTSYEIAYENQVVEDSDGNQITLQQGASMANCILLDNEILQIFFATKVNNAYTNVSCKYNTSTHQVYDYRQWKLDSNTMFTISGLVSKGVNPYIDTYMVTDTSVTLNVNANFRDAYKDGYYYIGVCGGNSLRYPIIVKTADFETFDIVIQLEQQHCHASFECSTSIVGNILYCCARQTGGVDATAASVSVKASEAGMTSAKFNYLLMNEVDLTNNKVSKVYIIRGSGSRPCLFNMTKNNTTQTYLGYAQDTTRQIGRVIKISGNNGYQNVLCEWFSGAASYMQFIPSETVDYTYMYLLGNIRKVRVGTQRTNLLDGRTLFNKIMAL